MLKIILPTIPMFVCLFWSVTLWADYSSKHRAKTFLGLFMFLSALLYFSHFCFFNGPYTAYRILDPFYNFLSISGYPFYYLYIRLLTKDVRLNRKQLWVLFPALFMGMLTAILRWGVYANNTAMEVGSFIDWNKVVKLLFVVIYVLQLPFIVYQSHKLIRAYNQRLENFYANMEGKVMNTTQRVLYILVIFSLISAVLSILGRSFFEQHPLLLLFPSISFAILMWFVGWVGFNQNFSIQDLQKEIDKLKKDQKNRDTGGYSQFTVSNAQLGPAVTKLLEEDKIFMSRNINLSKVAEMLNTNRSYLSNFINTEMGYSFSDMINHHRIEHAKKLLQNNTQDILNISEIGYKSGFSSDSSFFRTFKKNTGFSPKQYMQQEQSKI